MSNDEAEIPDEMFQGSGGGKATIEEVDDEANADNARTLEDIFAIWFERFNTNHPDAKARPSPGFVSWPYAVARVNELNAELPDDFPQAVVDNVLALCQCGTRHMHSVGTELDAQWPSDPQYERDLEHGRVKQRSLTSSPQNWFAVEVNEEHLRSVLGEIAARATGHSMAEADAAADERRTPGLVIAQRRQLDEGLGTAGASSAAHQPEGIPVGDTSHCPSGYRILVTPDGIVAAWYGPPRRSEAEAVADSWRHETQRR